MRMDKVGVQVELFLNVIRFLCKNGKGTVKILQGILWRFRQGLAVREAAELAERPDFLWEGVHYGKIGFMTENILEELWKAHRGRCMGCPQYL